MKILHVVPGLEDPTNGIAVAAKLIAANQAKSGNDVEVVDTSSFSSPSPSSPSSFDEIWVHSMWLPMTLRACWKVLRSSGPRLVRMPHGCMDPVKVRYHFYKKLPLLPIEWWLFRKSSRIVSTEDDEDRWIAGWHTGTEIERTDLFGNVEFRPRPGLGDRKFLFVGRLHPLKGVDVLIAAIRSLKESGELPEGFQLTVIGKDEKGMRTALESEVARNGLPVRFLGEVEESVKRREMAAADRLVLPTLSENFGLVVKESLELGVPVITTDGAKYWEGKSGVTYLKGYVAASFDERVRMVGERVQL